MTTLYDSRSAADAGGAIRILRRACLPVLASLLAACAGAPVATEPSPERPSTRPRFEDLGVVVSAAALPAEEVAQKFGQRLANRGLLVLRLWIRNQGSSAQRLARDNIRLLVPAPPDGTPEDFYRPLHPFRVAGLARAVPALGYDPVSAAINLIGLIDVAVYATQLEPLLPAEVLTPPNESRSMLLCFEAPGRVDRSLWRLALDFGDGSTGPQTAVSVSVAARNP